ncbi:MAG: P-II family nitrogen regulator [Peptococcaceae bacterium]|nr:P-II family nitrogen regulator [Peptococcaceae bacterium]
MKKVECVIRPAKLEEVKEALGKYGVKGMTVTNVIGCGLQQGKTEFYRGSTYTINLLPKVKIEVVVPDESLDNVIDIIVKTARTGEIGDGKIFVYDMLNAVRIRTGESGENAV